MVSTRAPLWILLLLIATLVTACGDNRKLVSVSVAPSQVSAQSAPVQFTATGTFSRPPSPVSPVNGIVWCIGSVDGTCNGNINAGAIVDGMGKATCNPGFSGTVNVLAGTPAMASPNPDGAFPLKVFGTAALACP
jgi:hypothetical protein